MLSFTISKTTLFIQTMVSKWEKNMILEVFVWIKPDKLGGTPNNPSNKNKLTEF